MAAQAVSLNRKEEAGRLVLEATGRWISSFAGQMERLVQEVEARRAKSKTVAIDASHIEQLDTAGAWLLERMRRDLEGQGAKAGSSVSTLAQVLLTECADQYGRTCNDTTPMRCSIP